MNTTDSEQHPIKLDGIDVTSSWYTSRVTDNNFYTVGGKIFADRLGTPLPPRSLKTLYKLFIQSPVPCFNDLFEDDECPIPDSTLYKLRGKLIDAEFIDGVTFCFLPTFFKKFLNDVDDYVNEVACLDSGISDSVAIGSAVIHKMYTYDTALQILRSSREAVFEFPDEFELSEELDYNSEHIQFIELYNYGRCTRVPRILQYVNRCSSCGAEDKSIREMKPTKCDRPVGRRDVPGGRGEIRYCAGKMVPIETDFVSRSLFSGQMHHKYNNITVFSLVDVPEGENQCAVFVCTNAKHTLHYLFVLAVKVKPVVATEYVPTLYKHACFEMIDDLDRLHDSVYGRHVVGHDWPKVAIQFALFGNILGNTGMNVRIYGRSGTGKSAVAFTMSHSLTDRSSYLDGSGTTHAGLVGSLDTITIDGQEVKYVVHGSLGKDLLTVVDEMDSNPKLSPHLKTALDSEELTKQIAHAPFRVTKTSTVIATGNINTTHLEGLQRDFDMLVDLYHADSSRFEFHSSYAGKSVEYFRDRGIVNPSAEDVVYKTIMLRERSRGVNYIDGEELAVVNRYAYVFYIGKDGEDDVDQFMPSKRRSGRKFLIGSTKGHEELSTPCFMDYMSMCAQNLPTIPVEMDADLDIIYKRLYDRDHIHSTGGRLSDLFHDSLIMSAALNRRKTVTYVDLLFVVDLWKHMCRHVEPSQLVRASYWDGPISESTARKLLGLDKRTDNVNVVVNNKQKIESAISKALDDYNVSDEELYLLRGKIKNLVRSLVTDYEIDTIEAKFMVDSYVASRQGEKVVTDQDVDILSVSDLRPFVRPPQDVSQNGLSNYIYSEFQKYRSIPESVVVGVPDMHDIDKLRFFKTLRGLNQHVMKDGTVYKFVE